MLEVKYEYIKGVLFVRLYGILNEENIYLLIKSVKRIIKIGGIQYVVINLENINCIDDGYIKILTNNMDKNNLFLCGIMNNNYNNFLVKENNVFNYVNF